MMLSSMNFIDFRNTKIIIQRLEATVAALESITIQDVNAICKELCEHLSHIDPLNQIKPAAIIACAPLLDRNELPFSLTEEEVHHA